MSRLALDFTNPHVSVHVSADILVPSFEHLNLRLQILVNPLHNLLTSLETLLIKQIVLDFPPVRTLHAGVCYLDAAAPNLFHAELVKLFWVLNAVSPNCLIFL
jgi:hypothetical protein